jgi:ABC-type transport system involved in multi-copper enzyme maturation permease subunit
MRDAYPVLIKELQELVGARDSRRGGAIQLLFAAALAGVLVPLRHSEIWGRWPPTIAVYYAVLAAILSTGLAADAFAGESERRTLETLMSTPAREFDILLGKACAVVMFGVTAGTVPWLISLIVAVARGVSMGPAIVLTGVCVWLSACTSLFFGTIAIGVSLRTTSARASQQVSSVLVLVVFAGGSFLWQELSLPFTVGAFCLGGACALVLGGLGLRILSYRFRRERLFARR